MDKNTAAVEDSSTMGLPHLTSFCWCMGLEMGSKVIGFVHLLVSVTLIVVCSIFAESARGNMKTVEDSDHLYTTWYKIAVTVCVVTALHVLLAATLLYSVYKRSTVGLRVWVITMSVLFVVSLLYLFVEICVRGFTDSGSDIFLSFLEGVIFFGLIVYSILCVYSYYLMLKSAEDMESPGKSYYLKS